MCLASFTQHGFEIRPCRCMFQCLFLFITCSISFYQFAYQFTVNEYLFFTGVFFFFFLVSIFDYHKHSCTSLCEGIYILYFLNKFLLIFGCAGSLLLHRGFWRAGTTLCWVCRLLIAVAWLVEDHGL